MLNREICKRCYNENEVKWHRGYEKFWDNGAVMCFAITDDRKIFEEDNVRTYSPNIPLWFIPENCPYALEHILETQNVIS